MNAETERPRYALPADVRPSRSTSVWGMLLFLTSEATLFGSLVSAYFYLRFNNVQWPLGAPKPPEMLVPSIMTAVLITSSIFMILGERGIRRGSQTWLRLGMGISWLLGLTFLILQGYEYSHETFGPLVNAYGSIFFAITGLHGTHVLVGLLISAVTQLRAWMGHFSAQRSVAVRNTALYWHFVDAVWIVIFSSLYIYPHLIH